MSASQEAPTPVHRTGVAVVTDSTPYLPPPLIDRWGIHQVSLYVGWDGDADVIIAQQQAAVAAGDGAAGVEEPGF